MFEFARARIARAIFVTKRFNEITTLRNHYASSRFRGPSKSEMMPEWAARTHGTPRTRGAAFLHVPGFPPSQTTKACVPGFAQWAICTSAGEGHDATALPHKSDIQPSQPTHVHARHLSHGAAALLRGCRRPRSQERSVWYSMSCSSWVPRSDRTDRAG